MYDASREVFADSPIVQHDETEVVAKPLEGEPSERGGASGEVAVRSSVGIEAVDEVPRVVTDAQEAKVIQLAPAGKTAKVTKAHGMGTQAVSSDRPSTQQRRRSKAKLRRDQSEDTDIVRVYLEDVGRVPLLTAEEETSLSQAIERGRQAKAQADVLRAEHKRVPIKLQQQIAEGEAAHSRFARANLRLVISIAKRYKTNNMELLDLVQEGNLGLLHAIDKFEWRKGFKFSTYATWWIKQAISRGIADDDRAVRLPGHVNDRIQAINSSRQRLTAQLNREPTLAEIADDTNLKPAKIQEAYDALTAQPSSLDMPIEYADGDRELHEIIADPAADDGIERLLEEVANEKFIKSALTELDERERAIISLRFGLEDGGPHTLEEVGRQFGVTRERIRQIETKALEKMRHSAEFSQYLHKGKHT